MIPEVDSHTPSVINPEPMATKISPWHACGPASSYEKYSAIMRRNSDLHLLEVILRLKAGETDTQVAAEYWEKTFGVRRNGEDVKFTNARIGFIKGQEGEADGIVSITIGVEGKKRLEEIIWRAKLEKLLTSDNQISMLGIDWKFTLIETDKKCRL